MRSALLLLALTAASLEAQKPIPDEPSCPRCQIRTNTLASLGATDGPGSLRGFGLIKLDGAGRFWIMHPPDLPIVFDSTGRVVTTSFRKGQGPNEFAFSASPMPLPGDSTLALDIRRATVLGPDLRAVRVIPFATMMDIFGVLVLRWPDLVMVNGYSPSRAQAVEPFATASLANNTLTLLKKFGAHPDEALPSPWEARASLVRDRNNIWAAEAHQYRITLWDTAGRIVRVLERKPAWFPGPSTPFGRRIDSPPPPVLQALTIDEQGLLWTFVSVPAPTWREAIPKFAAGQREVSSDAIDHEKRYRTIIEVIDPGTNRVVARRQMEQYFVAAFPGRRAAFYGVGFDGTPRYTIVRLTLAGLRD